MSLAPRFPRNVAVSVSGFPVPRADYCCSMPYHQNSLPLEPVWVAALPDIGVDQRTADGLMVQSSAISGAKAEVKSP